MTNQDDTAEYMKLLGYAMGKVEEQKATPGPAFKFEKVLAVDDEPAAERTFGRLLKKYFVGTDTFEFATGLADVQKLYAGSEDRDRYDLVLLDGLNGNCFPVYDTIRAVDQEVPIILHTSDFSLSDRSKQEGLDMLLWDKMDLRGLFNYLTKP